MTKRTRMILEIVSDEYREDAFYSVVADTKREATKLINAYTKANDPYDDTSFKGPELEVVKVFKNESTLPKGTVHFGAFDGDGDDEQSPRGIMNWVFNPKKIDPR